MSVIKEAKVWAIVQQLKSHERNGTVNCKEYLKLLKKFEELTGKEWDGNYDK